jgi:hypothetical protein
MASESITATTTASSTQITPVDQYNSDNSINDADDINSSPPPPNPLQMKLITFLIIFKTSGNLLVIKGGLKVILEFQVIIMH